MGNTSPGCLGAFATQLTAGEVSLSLSEAVGTVNDTGAPAADVAVADAFTPDVIVKFGPVWSGVIVTLTAPLLSP